MRYSQFTLLQKNGQCHISKTDIKPNHTTNIQNENKTGCVFSFDCDKQSVSMYVYMYWYLHLQNVPCVLNLLTETCTSPVTEQHLVTFNLRFYISKILYLISVFKVLKLIMPQLDFTQKRLIVFIWRFELEKMTCFFTWTVKLVPGISQII